MPKTICSRCGKPSSHYLTHVCEGCTCFLTEVSDPREPHINFPAELEFNPDCPRHGMEAS